MDYFQGTETDKPKRKSAAGRKLMRWDPDYDQLTLLCVEYVVSRDNVALDWNEVAKLVAPEINLSGEAVKQHLFKVRKLRTEAGKAVPPVLDRKATRKVSNMVGGGTPTPTPPRRSVKRKAVAADLDYDYGSTTQTTQPQPQSAPNSATKSTLSQPTPSSLNKTGSLLFTKPKKLKLRNASAKKDQTIKAEPNSDSDQTFQTPTKKPRSKKNRREGPSNFPATANTVVPTIEQPVGMTTSENQIELRPAMAINYAEDTMEDWENAEEEAKEEMIPSPEQNFAPIENALPAFEPTHGLPYLTGMAGVGYVPPPPAPMTFGPPLGAFNNNMGGYAGQETLGGFYPLDFPEMPAAPQPASLGDSFDLGEEIPWGMGFLGEGGEEVDPPLFQGFQ